MTVSKIYYTSNFAKKVQRLPSRYTKQVTKREKLFRDDPFNPVLKMHKLQGKLQDLWSFSITHSHRILFEFVSETEVLFHDVGGHEIYTQ